MDVVSECLAYENFRNDHGKSIEQRLVERIKYLQLAKSMLMEPIPDEELLLESMLVIFKALHLLIAIQKDQQQMAPDRDTLCVTEAKG